MDRDSLIPQTVGTQDISLPEVNIKEISATIGLNSGDVVILGGLISKRKTKNNEGVPFFSSIPLLGYLFKAESLTDESCELVIVLRVSII